MEFLKDMKEYLIGIYLVVIEFASYEIIKFQNGFCEPICRLHYDKKVKYFLLKRLEELE